MGGRELGGAIEEAEKGLGAEALVQFNLRAPDWLVLDGFDGTHSGAFGLSVLIGRYDFEQGPGHAEPNLVKSCAIVMQMRF